MNSKTLSEKKNESKYTRCSTCRQDILTEKMFLHEGFCQRNNIFCEHCEKVFLKTDYDEHLKDLRNSITNSAKSTEIDETEEMPVFPIINQTITTVINPNIYYEFIEMPWTEEYKVNKPIVISENGNILSTQNKNDYLLSFLGIQAKCNEYGQYNYNTNTNFYMNKNKSQCRNVFQSQINQINNYMNYSFDNGKMNYNNQKNKIKETNNKQIKKKVIPDDNYNSKRKYK